MPKENISSLTALRGIAAMMIVLFHLSAYLAPQIGTSIAPYSAFLLNSYLWVDSFFLLSGFIITYVYHNRCFSLNNYKSFIIARFARIYPLHFFVLICLFSLELFSYLTHETGFGSSRSLDSFIKNVFLLQAIQVDARSTTWNHPSWSISLEWHVYLLLPLLILILQWMSEKVRGTVILLSFFMLLFIYRATQWQLDLTGYLGFFRCLFEVMIGSSTFLLLKRSEKFKDLRFLPYFPLALLVAVFCSLHFDLHDLVTIILMLLLIISLYLSHSYRANIFHNKALVYLGEISYSVYITHYLSFQIIRIVSAKVFHIDIDTLTTSTTLLLLSILSILSVVGVAAITYKYIEIPARYRIKEKFIKPTARI